MKTSHQGFTLIELMIVVAIIGILAVIAYPSYQDYTRRGNRAAAQSFMMEISSAQTQYLLDARNYAVGSSVLTTLGLATPTTVSPFYVITVENSVVSGVAVTSPPNFQITATPTAGQTADGTLTLTHTGAQTRGGVTGWK